MLFVIHNVNFNWFWSGLIAPTRKIYPMSGDATWCTRAYVELSVRVALLDWWKLRWRDIILHLPGSCTTMRFKKREWEGEAPSWRSPLLSSNRRRASVNCMSHATRRCRHCEGSQQAPCNDSDGGGFMVIGGAASGEGDDTREWG